MICSSFDETLKSPFGANLGISSETEYENMKNSVKCKLHSEISENNDPNQLYIFSTESAYMYSQGQLESLVLFLSKLFDEVKLLLYLRNPVQHAASSLSQVLKAGRILHQIREPDSAASLSRYNYKSKLSDYELIFKRQSIIVQLYEQATSSNIGLFGNFCESIGIKNQKWSILDFKNLSLSSEEMKILYKVNISCKELRKALTQEKYSKLIRKRGKFVSLFSQKYIKNKTSFLPSRLQYHNYMKVYGPDISWLADNYSSELNIYNFWGEHVQKFAGTSINLSDCSDICNNCDQLISDEFNKFVLEYIVQTS